MLFLVPAPPAAMDGDISADLALAFYHAVLKHTVKNNPQQSDQSAKELGARVGKRLADDFCAKQRIFVKCEAKDIPKYLAAFFKCYLHAPVDPTDGTLALPDSFGRFSGPCGRWFFAGVLSSVFEPITEQTSFTVSGDLIEYKSGGVSGNSTV